MVSRNRSLLLLVVIDSVVFVLVSMDRADGLRNQQAR